MNAEQPSQSQQDAYDDQRILHDAALIVGGARHREGRLHVTDEQLNTFEEENGRRSSIEPLVPVHQVGETALRMVSPHKSAELEAGKSEESWKKEVVNREELADSIATVTEPYLLMFGSLVPSADELVRNWRGNVKEGIYSVSESRKLEVNHRPINYEMKIDYAQTAAAANLVGAQVVASHDSGDSPVKPFDDLEKGRLFGAISEANMIAGVESKIADGRIDTVFCRTGNGGGFSLTANGLLGTFPDSFRDSNPRMLKFSLGVVSPTLEIDSGAYTYDAAQDNFKYSSPHGASQFLPGVITTSEYLETLQAVLHLYPTEEVQM